MNSKFDHWNRSSLHLDESYISMDGLVQDCSTSIANTLELLQSCTKTAIYFANTDHGCSDMEIPTETGRISVFVRLYIKHRKVPCWCFVAMSHERNKVANFRKFNCLSDGFLAFSRKIHWSQLDSSHKWPVVRKWFPCHRGLTNIDI